jgi:transcriptional regulator with XRE-family HTH domain
MLEANSFGNVLKSLRVRRGKLWTQEQTAELLGVSRRTYLKWEDEDDKNIPSAEYLKKIVALFRLSQEERDTLYLAAAQLPPQVDNIPFPQNPLFTGREARLEQLKCGTYSTCQY